MAEYWQELITFFKTSYNYTLAITFFICMAESIVGLSLLVPSTAILISFSVLMSASGLDFLTLLLVAGLGASFGDWISFSLGYYSKDSLQKRWPLRNNPDWLIKGESFFERWGWASMFIARFMGPLRSITPLQQVSSGCQSCNLQ